jgi:hypothetical protein
MIDFLIATFAAGIASLATASIFALIGAVSTDVSFTAIMFCMVPIFIPVGIATVILDPDFAVGHKLEFLIGLVFVQPALAIGLLLGRLHIASILAKLRSLQSN